MATIFSARDRTTWRAKSLPPSSLPPGAEGVSADQIFERTRRAISDENLSLADARQLAADALLTFHRVAEEEERAHQVVLDLSSSKKQAEDSAAARGKHQTVMERLDSAIGHLLGEVLERAGDRDRQATLLDRHSKATERVKAAAKAMRVAEAGFLRAREECKSALADAREANRELPRGGNTIKIPEELTGEVIVLVEQVERWSQQDAKGVVTAYDDRDVDDQGGKRIGVHNRVGFVRRAVFDRVVYRRVGDDEELTRLRHRPDLKVERADDEPPELPSIDAEKVLEALAQGTQTYIEHGAKTIRRM